MNTQAAPKDGWELAFYLGTSFSKNETLTIEQDGYPDITLKDAELAKKPLILSPITAFAWADGMTGMRGKSSIYIRKFILMICLPKYSIRDYRRV